MNRLVIRLPHFLRAWSPVNINPENGKTLAHKTMNTEEQKMLYHPLTIPIVFVPKRRRPVLVNDIARRLQEIIFELVQEHNWRLIALEIQPDHLHMFVNTPTDEAPSQIALRG
jgi:hypothetical protein